MLMKFTRITDRSGRHLSGQEIHYDTVLIGRPDAAVTPNKRGTGTLLAAEAQRYFEQSINEPLEANRCLKQPAPQPRRYSIDHAAAHQGLSDARARGPSRPVIEEV